MAFPPHDLSYTRLTELAGEFLQEFHPEGQPPVPIEQIVEFDLRITVVPVDGLKHHLDVDAFLTNDLEQIFVDEWVMLHAPARFRFSLAHEVAHLWLHDELYQSCSIQSVADWAQVQASIGAEVYAVFEREANSFAGLVLVPPDDLKLAFRNIVAKAESGGLSRRSIDHHPIRQRLIQEIAKRFDVSEKVMEIRLERDGLLARVGPPSWNGGAT